MTEYSRIGFHARLIESIVLPHFAMFAFIVFAMELAVGVLLVSGLFVRVGALIGLMLSLNLYIGLAYAPGEWPWIYVLMIVIHLVFLTQATHYFGLGRMLDQVETSSDSPTQLSSASQPEHLTPAYWIRQLKRHYDPEHVSSG